MSEKSPWAADTDTFVPHETPAVPDFVGTDITSTESGQIHVNRAQDVEPILERCKELARTESYRSASNEMHHAAEFPLVLVEKYLADKGVTWEEFLQNSDHVKAMMRDPALSLFLIAKNATHGTYR